ncbi:MAG: lysylphosphatidylglycerol synthase transmembrane domain-containing protein [candidate division WOR-3 bacterium]
MHKVTRAAPASSEPAGPHTETSVLKPSPAKKGLKSLIRVAVSVGLLAALVFLFRDRLPQAVGYIRHLQPVPLLLATLWYGLFVLVSAWRWQVLLTARGLRFSTWYLTRVFVLGLFFCKLLPTSIGGDVMRIAYTAPKGRGVDAFSATFLDRLIGFVSLSFLAVASALVLFATQGLWGQNLALRKNHLGAVTASLRGDLMFALLLLILVLLVAMTLMLFNDRAHRLVSLSLGRVRFAGVGTLLDRAYSAVKQFRNHYGPLGVSFTLGIGVQTCLSFSWYHSAQAVGAAVPLVYYLIFIPLLNIVVNVPSIGGLGVREASFVALFTQSWVSGALTDSRAFAIAVVFLALDLVFALVGGLLFAFMRRPSGTA